MGIKRLHVSISEDEYDFMIDNRYSPSQLLQNAIKEKMKEHALSFAQKSAKKYETINSNTE